MHKLKKSMIVYKKIYNAPSQQRHQGGDLIATLLLPKGTLVRLKPTADNAAVKNRANRAIVLDIVLVGYPHNQVSKGYAGYDNTRYTAGARIKPAEKFSQSREECASGIHFFLSRQRAFEY